MKTSIHFQGKRFNNPPRKTISRILKTTPVHYEMSLYIVRSRLKERIERALRMKGRYQTRSGAILELRNNRTYLTLGCQIGSIRDVKNLEKKMEESKEEVVLQYPAYPENIKKIEMFNKMLGKAWNEN